MNKQIFVICLSLPYLSIYLKQVLLLSLSDMKLIILTRLDWKSQRPLSVGIKGVCHHAQLK